MSCDGGWIAAAGWLAWVATIPPAFPNDSASALDAEGQSSPVDACDSTGPSWDVTLRAEALLTFGCRVAIMSGDGAGRGIQDMNATVQVYMTTGKAKRHSGVRVFTLG